MTDEDPSEFDAERQAALGLLDDNSITAFYLGVIHDGETVETTFAQTAEDPQQEGLQALSLLATHVRIVANKADVDPATVAGDAATLAGRLDELAPRELANIEAGDDEAATDQ